MLSLLSKILTGLVIVLVIPSTLALASQNAIPGDTTYSIKRALEGAILAVASVNPGTRAYFQSDFSSRRLNEAVALIQKGDNASESLTELVTQTQQAATDINTVSNTQEKQQLADNLSQKINEYNQKLVQIQQSDSSISTETTVSIPTSTTTQILLPTQSPQNTAQTLPTPTAIAIPTSTPSPQVNNSTSDENQLKQTIDDLKNIQQQLQDNSRSNNSKNEDHDSQNHNNDKKNPDKKEPK